MGGTASPTAKGTIGVIVLLVLCLGVCRVSSATDCDKALSLFSVGMAHKSDEDAARFYMQSIELCPGFIRPYELVGNWLRNKSEDEKAIGYFSKAASLGSTNHKLYYLLADLLFRKGNLDEAYRQLTKSLSLRDDYEPALALKARIGEERDTVGPRLILFEPALLSGEKASFGQENITVRGRVTDKSGVAWVRVNQMQASLEEDGYFLKDLSLQIGANRIVVEASDGPGNVSSLEVTLERVEPEVALAAQKAAMPDARELYTRSFAVVIGINNYTKWPALEFAVRDAKALQKKLQESGFDEIITLLDKEATQRRILTVLGFELPGKVGREDRVVFFFAGHGQTEDTPGGGKKGYIIPVDADLSNYAGTAVSMEQIKELSNLIPAKHILFAMDSCYSGIGLVRSMGPDPGLGGYLRKVASMRTVQMVTAGGQGEQVLEKEGHGLFTRFFLRAIEGEADVNKDGVVTGTELGAYLRPQVSIASNNAQTPLFGRLEGEGEFLFFVTKK
jgi:tetratricopeptide (TPR) repeat protein